MENDQAAESEEKQEGKEVTEEKSVKKPVEKTVVGPLLVFLLIVNSLLALFIFYNQTQFESVVEESLSENSGQDGKEKSQFNPHGDYKPKENHILESMEFKNLQANFRKEGGPKRYLALSFTLLVETPEDSPLNEIRGLEAKIKDRIYAMTNKLTHRDLLKLEGREVYKKHLIDSINKLLTKDHAVKVLYQQFLVR